MCLHNTGFRKVIFSSFFLWQNSGGNYSCMVLSVLINSTCLPGQHHSEMILVRYYLVSSLWLCTIGIKHSSFEEFYVVVYYMAEIFSSSL